MTFRSTTSITHGTSEVLTDQERRAIAHLRGWCHYGPKCPICTSEQRAMTFWKAKGRQEATNEIAEGQS